MLNTNHRINIAVSGIKAVNNNFLIFFGLKDIPCEICLQCASQTKCLERMHLARAKYDAVLLLV